MMTIRVILALGAASVAACAGGSAVEPAAPMAPAPTTVSTGFENPGGMWMPSQLASQEAQLKEAGLELDPAALSNPLAEPLAAIVSLGGCSASFVSPEGLIITNHHCVQSALQYHSTPEDNLVDKGYLAKTRADEKNNGPTARVYVTQAITDVTDKVLGGLESLTDDKQRYDEIENREKQLIAACEKGRPEIRCDVASFFAGSQFHQIEKLEIRDVRLVYAPHHGVGWYGGDEDNWMWPRHTADYSFYRAYVGKDGKPADYSADNVAYKPAHYLKVSTSPLKEGDFVMVAGYPGRTSRHKISAEVKVATEWTYPRNIQRNKEFIALLAEVSKLDKDAAIKAQTWSFWMNNSMKNNQGMMDGLVKGGLAQAKARQEEELRAWIAANPERTQKYGKVLDELEALIAEDEKYRTRDAALGEVGFSKLLSAAGSIVRMAEERPKRDADRDPSYQQRNWKRIFGRQTAFARSYNQVLDRALLGHALKRALGDADANADWLHIVFGKAPLSEQSIPAVIDRLYKGTKLESDNVRLGLLKTASTKKLAKSRDPFIRLAVALRPLEKEIEEREKRVAGAMAVLKPRYMAALREFKAGQMAPDANGTLRVTYGTVRGYKPRPDAEPYVPFSTAAEMVAKHTGQEPFNAPQSVLDAIKAGNFGPYADGDATTLKLDFLADLDITGGNSGSSTLNGKGELVGLVFDGNYESMASDWLFMPELTRSIHADLRYILWMMDAVDKADHLLEEMGVKPAID